MNYTQGKLEPIRALDGVRGIAILMVIFGHVEIFHRFMLGSDLKLPWADHFLMRLMENGWMGVQLFFVLSGFLITRILLIRHHHLSSLLSFYGRRIRRIFPLYYLYLVVYFFLIPLFVDPQDTDGSKFSFYYDHQIYLWCYLGNFLRENGICPSGELMQFWSLAVEEQFYLFMPAIVVLLPKDLLRPACILMIFLSLAYRLSATWIWGDSPLNIYVDTFAAIEPIFWGALLAVFMESCDASSLVRFRPVAKFVAIMSTGLVTAILISEGQFYQLTTIRYGFSGYFPLVQTFGLSLISLVFVSSLFLILTSERDFSILLGNRFITVMGRYSYGIYIFHPMLIGAVILSGLSWPALSVFFMKIPLVSLICFLMIVIALSLLTGIVSWHLIEKRFLTSRRF